MARQYGQSTDIANIAWDFRLLHTSINVQFCATLSANRPHEKHKHEMYPQLGNFLHDFLPNKCQTEC